MVDVGDSQYFHQGEAVLLGRQDEEISAGELAEDGDYSLRDNMHDRRAGPRSTRKEAKRQGVFAGLIHG